MTNNKTSERASRKGIPPESPSQKMAQGFELKKSASQPGARRALSSSFLFFFLVSGTCVMTFVVMVLGVVSVVSPVTFRDWKLSIASTISEENVKELLETKSKSAEMAQEIAALKQEATKLQNESLQLKDESVVLREKLAEMAAKFESNESKSDELKSMINELNVKLTEALATVPAPVSADVRQNQPETTPNDDSLSEVEKLVTEMGAILDLGISKAEEAKTSADRDEIVEETKNLLIRWCDAVAGKPISIGGVVRDVIKEQSTGNYFALIKIDRPKNLDNRVVLTNELHIPISAETRQSIEPDMKVMVNAKVYNYRLSAKSKPAPSRSGQGNNFQRGDPIEILYRVAMIYNSRGGGLNFKLTPTSPELTIGLYEMELEPRK